jgi:hypothetical protein
MIHVDRVNPNEIQLGPDMSEDLHDDVRLLDFVEKLKELRATCGGPSLRKIADTSGRLTALYGERYRDLPVLSPSALSNALNGRRKGPLSWDWVAAFVLSCQRWGWEAGALREAADLGPGSLAVWRARWLDTTVDDPTAVEPHPGDPTAGQAGHRTGEPADDPAAEPEGGPVGGKARPRDLAAMVDSLTARRYRDLFGEHGVDLLHAADDELDADAACRLGILLACHGSPSEATAWLQRPAAEDNGMALALVGTTESHLPGRAAEFAYELGQDEVGGRQPEAGRSPDVSEVYFEAAARAGHVDACYRIAVRRRAAGKDADAVRWFARAARQGHRHAPGGLAEIEQQIMWRGAPDMVPAEWVGEA